MNNLRSALVAGVSFAAICAGGQAALAADCGAMLGDGTIENATVTSATPMPTADGLPAYCELEASLSSGEGSEIIAMIRLPDAWNGKFYAAGGGGYAGDITLEAVANALSRGYATINTDMGHVSEDSLGMEWIIEEKGKLAETRVADFGVNAAHLSAVVGKAAVKSYYGEAPSYAYWEGCSTGGRQGMTESQRFPDDFDGIIAGAPVFNWGVFSQSIWRTQHFRNTPDALITAEQVPLIRDAVLESCDGIDGVVDGYINNPLACEWDPAELVCEEGQDGVCLTPTQAEAVAKVYTGYVTPDGVEVADPTMHGGEADWVVRYVGIPPMPQGLNVRLGGLSTAYLYKTDPDWDILSFDPDVDTPEMLTVEANKYMIADDPDITPFVKSGGKLLLWHGFNDSGPSPLQTAAYYQKAEATVSPNIDGEWTDSARLFLAPGVGHCGGGGGPDEFDLLTAMENWVEKGDAPARILATKADSEMTRPLCPFPAIATYKGSGDTNDAANFDCAPMDPMP